MAAIFCGVRLLQGERLLEPFPVSRNLGEGPACPRHKGLPGFPESTAEAAFWEGVAFVIHFGPRVGQQRLERPGHHFVEAMQSDIDC
eukprot:12586957-Alexandrium_andersonii.AAC.1